MQPARSPLPELRPVSRRTFLSFFVLGLLLSLLGALLPMWGYRLGSNFTLAGHLFLAFNCGIVLANPLAGRLLRTTGARRTMMAGCGLAAAGLLMLSWLEPWTSSVWSHAAALLVLGMAAGFLNRSVIFAITPVFRQDPWNTVNFSALVFVLGSLVAAVLVSVLFYTMRPAAILTLVALVPAIAAIVIHQSAVSETPVAHSPPFSWRSAFRDPRRVLAVATLVVQFSNECTVSGWLALFLIHRIGLSVSTAMQLLMCYWLALLASRIVAQRLLFRFSHGRLLAISVLAALLGCLVLAVTDNLFGAAMAVLLIGAGFAPVYPLLVENIGARFPGYDPAPYNRIFFFALTVGMLAPAVLGYMADVWGLRVIAMATFIGVLLVFLLLLVIWLDNRFRLITAQDALEDTPARR